MAQLVGPDGQPTGSRLVRATDAGVTYAAPGEQLTVEPRQLLMAMARRRRDGASHAAIISEYELTGEARSPFVLARALAFGERLLNEAIARGEQPVETKGFAEEDDD